MVIAFAGFVEFTDYNSDLCKIRGLFVRKNLQKSAFFYVIILLTGCSVEL
jgi:hypothetical protein